MSVFASNLEFVKNDKSGTMGITKFFDLTLEEFARTYLTKSQVMLNPSPRILMSIPPLTLTG